MEVLVTLACALLMAAAEGGHAHLGFDVADEDGRPTVTKVHATTSASWERIRTGDVVVSVGGKATRNAQEVIAQMADRKPGDPVRVRVLRKPKGSETIVVRLADEREIKAEVERDNERAARVAKMEADRDARQAEDLRRHGAARVVAGEITTDVLGQPQVNIRIDNRSEEPIDAVEVRVAIFDKFGRPVPGIFGASHEKTYLYQEVIGGRRSVVVTAAAPWHNTAGQAKVSITRYIHVNGRDVTPPEPETVTVRR